jgi:hypothetical protein
MVQEYYVGFSRYVCLDRAEGSNKDTGEDADMVTIVKKQKGLRRKSRICSSLNLGDQCVIKNCNGLRDVDVDDDVRFTGLHNGDATTLVT